MSEPQYRRVLAETQEENDQAARPEEAGVEIPDPAESVRENEPGIGGGA
jgi:hypothetical protein